MQNSRQYPKERKALRLNKYINRGFETNNVTGIILLDVVHKIFDIVEHEHLVQKMNQMECLFAIIQMVHIPWILNFCRDSFGIRILQRGFGTSTQTILHLYNRYTQVRLAIRRDYTSEMCTPQSQQLSRVIQKLKRPNKQMVYDMEDCYKPGEK